MAEAVRSPAELCDAAAVRARAVNRSAVRLAQATRVFLALLSYMEWHGLVRVSQVEIGQRLGMSRRNVYGAIERLITHGLLIRDKKIGALATYRVSPFVAHRGRSVDLHMAQRQDTARQRLEALSEALHAGQALDVTKLAR